nr:MBOAT family O-acyltransferase [uncultured Gemmiger sp.]
MGFSSVQFLFVFLPLALAVYFVLPVRTRNVVMGVFSLAFCTWAGIRYSLLLAVFALVHWGFGLLLQRRPRRGILGAMVAADLLLLGFYKYAGFFAETANALPGIHLPVLALALPLGISFYTFQGISYCVDVFRGTIPPERNPLRLYLYFACFAHVSSGPIVRYGFQSVALDPLAPERQVTLDRMYKGIRRFVLGLGKKTLIADQLELVYAAVSGTDAARLPGPVLLLGYAAFAVQLYYDFSGYSDMAIGLGEMFGLPLPENFDYPYLSRSIGEFWRRWHITLGAWFRDYLYIPLGGSRRGTARTCLNLLIVFACTGFWHGAAWQYLAFGLWHGVLSCLERLGLRKALDRAPVWVSHLYTVLAVFVGFTFFGAPSLGQALAALGGILTWQAGAPGMTFAAFGDPKTLLLLAAGILLCGPVQAAFPKLKSWLRGQQKPGAADVVLVAVLLFFSIMRTTAGNYTAFIYAQF